MTKPTIAIDIDDVIADGTGHIIQAVNRIHDLTLTHEDYHAVGGEFHGYYERVWRAHGLEDRVSYADVDVEMEYDQTNVPLLAGAEFALHELAQHFKIVFITARPTKWEAATRGWFAQHFSDDDVQLYFAGSHDGTMTLTKGQQAKKLGATLLIDDNISNCLTAVEEGVEAILFGEYGWQKDAPSSLKRCKTWQEVLEHLNVA